MLFTTFVVASIFCSINALDALTPAFLVRKGREIENLNDYPIGNDPATFLVNYTDPNYDKIISNIIENHVPIVVGADETEVPYNLSTYFSELKTKHFGRNIIIADNIPSGMNIAHDFGNIHGLVLIANKLTKARGSNNTKWESPRGDIYMDINLKLTNQSQAGLLPIHCALSLISAVQSTPLGDYSKLPIKFSWLISITWMPWNKKIGGVLVEPTHTNDNDNFWYTSGCGMRVNSELEYSVSKMIDEHNAKNPNNQVKQIELPSLIARTVNYLEEYYELLETDTDAFINLVTKYWVNGKQKVNINVRSQIVDLERDGSIVLKDNNGLTSYLKSKPERFGFDPINFIN